MTAICLTGSLAWMAWEWRHTHRRLGLVLKALSFTAILLALSEPRITNQETKVAAMVLVDTSASTSDTDLQRASEWSAAINSAKGRHYVRIIPFARNTRAIEKVEQEPVWRPDARGVVYLQDRDATRAVHRVFAASRAATPVADLPGMYAWPRVGPDSETVVMAFTSARRPTDVWVRESDQVRWIGNGAERRNGQLGAGHRLLL